jgi:signal transduction histidine kinase
MYACLKHEKPTELAPQASTGLAVGWSVAIVVGLMSGLTLLVTAGEPFLPRVFLDAIHIAPLAHYILAFNLLLGAGAFAILWMRRRSVLDQWLLVVDLALTSELVINGLFISARFTLGWYVSRVFAIATSTIVLAVLLDETIRMYGRLARSNAMLVRERNSKLMTLEALVASIIHEVRQPLTGVAANGGALLRFLRQAPPMLEKASSSAEAMVAASHRISEILDDVRNLFGKVNQEPGPVDVNDLMLETLRTLDKELKDHAVVTRVELTPELPPVMGHRGQLQEVIVNLIQNAIEAMEAVDEGGRTLQVKTERYSGDAISLTIVDTGPGIESKNSDEIFEAFFTTKSHGMGLGLAISRMIVERHGGQLPVFPATPHGSAFQLILPQMKLG